MKFKNFLIFLIIVNISACASFMQKKTVELTNTSVETPFKVKELSKVVIFNGSNWLLYGFANEAGNIHVKIDGHEIGSLKTGKYLVAAVPEGRHEVELSHTDTMSFVSNHILEVSGDILFYKIGAEMTSNNAELVPQPENFEKRYKLCCSEVVLKPVANNEEEIAESLDQ